MQISFLQDLVRAKTTRMQGPFVNCLIISLGYQDYSFCSICIGYPMQNEKLPFQDIPYMPLLNLVNAKKMPCSLRRYS